MLPPDPMIAYGEAMAMIAKRHADAARHRSVAVARNQADQSALDQSGSIAHRLAMFVGRMRGVVAARSHGSPPREKPGTVVG